MNKHHPDFLIRHDEWSDLGRFHDLPKINVERMNTYRQTRLKQMLKEYEVDLLVLVSPVSLRYAMNYRNYALFSSHIPCTYLFVSVEGPLALHNALAHEIDAEFKRPGRPIAHFYGGDDLASYAELLTDDIAAYMAEIGCSGRRIGLEYVNPSITQALESKGFEVCDGVVLSERARLIKSEDELECIRWAMRVAEHGADKVKEALQPGVTELQLWGLLNYTNLANDGDWHDGRMLASGERINPWLQEASSRVIQDGDLVGFDTDMVGPFGYFADLSRTFHCGPSSPTARQKELYQLAKAEIDHNLDLIKGGIRFSEILERAYPVPKEYQTNAYTCVIHGVGMCDEYPHLHPTFRGPSYYEDELVAGMVICVESYMGAEGERDGVKLEQQVLVTETGYELITQYPYEDTLLS
ncbi:MAG: Xaa-Pro peptidase family protein [Pseudomonadota bacterium]